MSATVATITGIDAVSDFPGVDTISVHQGPGADLDWKDGSRTHIMAVVGSTADYDELHAVYRLLHNEVTGTYADVKSTSAGAVGPGRRRRTRRGGEGAADEPAGPAGGERWTCAFVNNMPDGAFDATERQYLGLLEAGSGDQTIEVRLHTLEKVPRGERVAARIAAGYLPVGAARGRPARPADRDRVESPGDSHRGRAVLGRSGRSPLLGAGSRVHHVAVVPLGSRRTGRLRRYRADDAGGQVHRRLPPAGRDRHPLVAGLGPAIVLPHSRLNTVAVDDLRGAGYEVALHSDAVGWSVATKTVDRCRVLVMQGHPEYDPSSLLREYHRDARRYVLGERDDVPRLPLHCVAPGDWEELRTLHERIVGGERAPSLVESFPFEELGRRAPWPWRDTATGLYANWMTGVTKRSDSEHA